jgi:hypothetical protein
MKNRARFASVEDDPVRILVPPSLEDIRAVPLYSHDLLTYMMKRGFEMKRIHEMGVRESDYVGEIYLPIVDESGEIVDSVRKWINLQGAVIFPIYDNGYRGYQARHIYATDKGKRWMSAPGVSRKTLIFNADRAFSKEHDFFVVAEGIPAACAFGIHGVATFGKSYTNTQLGRMCAAPQKNVYVAFDGDAQYESHKLGQHLAEVGKNVRVIPFSGTEDPDSVPDLMERMKRAVPPDPLSEMDLSSNFYKQYRRQANGGRRASSGRHASSWRRRQRWR